MTIQLENLDCGCDCDLTTGPSRDFAVELSESEFKRLVREKFARAERYRRLMDKLEGQFETD